MPDRTPPDDAATAFDRSRELFEQAAAELADPAAGDLAHGELEERVAARSRSPLQEHLDLRAAREPRRGGVVDAGGRTGGFAA
jgi:hypothetical protein